MTDQHSGFVDFGLRGRFAAALRTPKGGDLWIRIVEGHISLVLRLRKSGSGCSSGWSWRQKLQAMLHCASRRDACSSVHDRCASLHEHSLKWQHAGSWFRVSCTSHGGAVLGFEGSSWFYGPYRLGVPIFGKAHKIKLKPVFPNTEAPFLP